LVPGTGDDPTLLGCRKTATTKNAFDRTADPLQLVKEPPSRAVLTHNPASDHPAPKAPDVVDDVRCTPETKTLRGDSKYRYRSFRRNPLNLPPNKTVQHQIPHHEDSSLLKPAEQVKKSLRLD
jgi:hypothetical protein